jgi:hypothetical protein
VLELKAYLNPLKHSGYYIYHFALIFSNLLMVCVCVSYDSQRKYFSELHWRTGVCNEDETHSLLCRKRIVVCLFRRT